MELVGTPGETRAEPRISCRAVMVSATRAAQLKAEQVEKKKKGPKCWVGAVARGWDAVA